MDWIVLWLLITNTLAFALFGIDKVKAKRRQWRIPEATLLGIAASGGGMGALLGMQIFRHKTKHAKFLIGIPLCLGFNILVAGFLISKIG